MSEQHATLTGKVLGNYVVVITKPARDLLGIQVGDYVELTVRKKEPVVPA